jgi:hypothetical protein
MASLRTPQVVTKEVVAASFGFYRSEEVRALGRCIGSRSMMKYNILTFTISYELVKYWWEEGLIV